MKAQEFKRKENEIREQLANEAKQQQIRFENNKVRIGKLSKYIMFSIAAKSNNDYSDGREKSPFIKKNRYPILKFQDPETK